MELDPPEAKNEGQSPQSSGSGGTGASIAPDSDSGQQRDGGEEQPEPLSSENRFIPPDSTITKDIQTRREEAARSIAKKIVMVFRHSVLGALGGGLFLFLLLLHLQGVSTTGALFKDAVIPFVQAVGTFATTVFGPLLAFILGYYFSEKNKS